MAGFGGIGTLSHKHSDAFLTDPGNLSDIGRPINRRSMVDLVVSCGDDQTLWRIDRESQRFRDTVIDSENFHGKAAKFEDIHIGINNFVFQLFIVFFVQGLPDQSKRQWRSVDGRKIDILEDMFQGSDMI